MDIFSRRLDLQLFADGGDGGGDGAATGVTAVDAGQQQDSTADRLRALGVPEAKLTKHRAKKQAQDTAANVVVPAPAQAAAAKTTADTTADTSATTTADAKKPTWDELMADPDYNKQMQSVVQERLKKSKGAEDNINKLTPAIELMAKKYGMDAANLDYGKLAESISHDAEFFEDDALNTGKSVDTVMEEFNRKQQENLKQQKIRAHMESLVSQEAELKKTFPTFSLPTELNNPVFARMVSPDSGLTVEDAYYAVHRKEIQTAAMQETMRQTAEKLSRATQAGSRRPAETGASTQAPSVTTFDYSKASRQQKDEIKRKIRAAAARGEKLYPGW